MKFSEGLNVSIGFLLVDVQGDEVVAISQMKPGQKESEILGYWRKSELVDAVKTLQLLIEGKTSVVSLVPTFTANQIAKLLAMAEAIKPRT